MDLADTTDSLIKCLESVHDACISQRQLQEEEMQVAGVNFQNSQHPYLVNNPGMIATAPNVDTGHISLSLGSTNCPSGLEEMECLEDDSALPELKISSQELESNIDEVTQLCPGTQPGPSGVPMSWTDPNQQLPTIHHPDVNVPERCPASSTGSNVINGSHDASSNNAMPSGCAMDVVVGYLSSNDLLKKSISDRGGFLLFHEKTPNPSKLPEGCKYIKFPAVPKAKGQSRHNVSSKENTKLSMTEKDQENIEHIMQNMQGGLQVRCQDGCIYATRWSTAKIFYRNCNSLDDVTLDELPRSKEVMVFNYFPYKASLVDTYQSLQSGIDTEVRKKMNPAVYFTFAQKWVPGTVPLNKCLVWAKVTPSLAHHIWDGLLHPNENGQKWSLTNSYHLILQMSNDPSDCNNFHPHTC